MKSPIFSCIIGEEYQIKKLEFMLYIIKVYQRLKKDEVKRLAIGWDAKREVSKINYRIHTNAVKEFLITPTFLEFIPEDDGGNESG